MKKTLCLILAIFLTLACLPMSAFAAENEPIKILAIGNSFTNNSVTYVSQFADATHYLVNVCDDTY